MSTFSTNLALELIGNGEQAGNWGQTTNTNLGTLVEQAISGYTTQAISDVADTTLTMTQGASATARNMFIELTGALTGARNLIVPSNRKLYFIFNNTTGGFAVTVKVSGQTGVSVPNATKTILVSNGTDIVLATTPPASGVTSVSTSGTVNGLTLTGGPITSTGTITLGGSLSGTASGLTVGNATNATNATNASFATTAGSVSSVAASIVQAGTFSTGSFTFNSGSFVAFGDANPSPTLWRSYFRALDGNPAIVTNRGSNIYSNCIVCNDELVSSSISRPYITFTNNNTGIAAITTPDGATIVYGIGSDYRLKTNVMPLTGSTAKVKALKPCSYNWIKVPEVSGQGFLAHELAEVVPQAVVGEKDALYSDGSINIQQVDLSYVIPLLTSALQEAIAKIEALEVRITALESQ